MGFTRPSRPSAATLGDPPSALTRKLIEDGLKPSRAPHRAAPPPGWIPYGDWWISYDPPPIPPRDFDWQFWHDDFDGPEDTRCGHAASLEAAKAEIDAIEAEAEAA